MVESWPLQPNKDWDAPRFTLHSTFETDDLDTGNKMCPNLMALMVKSMMVVTQVDVFLRRF